MNGRRPVPRIGRVIDVVAALVFIAGAGLYARSWVALRDMDEYVRPEGGDTFAAIAHADELSRLGRVGVALMVGGILLGVAAAVIARRIAARGA